MGRPSTSQSPSVFVLYRFYNEDDSLLYVGLTRDPSRRISQHAGDKSWWTNVSRIEIAHFDSLEELRSAERDAITTEKPVHNVRMNGTKQKRSETETDAREKVEIDGLVGRFFHTFEDASDDPEDDKHATRINGRILHWQGRVLEQINDELYTIETFSWWDGIPTGHRLARVDDMLDWRFYDSSLEMQVALPCGESLPWRDGDPCHGVREYWSGSHDFLHFICHSCRKNFPGFADYPEIIWRNGKPHLK